MSYCTVFHEIAVPTMPGYLDLEIMSVTGLLSSIQTRELVIHSPVPHDSMHFMIFEFGTV